MSTRISLINELNLDYLHGVISLKELKSQLAKIKVVK